MPKAQSIAPYQGCLKSTIRMALRIAKKLIPRRSFPVWC
nr:MAG TPA: hypothetical protein [Caudoviricetes sp.]